MAQVQLHLANFQGHPECAAGIITLDQAVMMMQSKDLTYEGACYLLPPRAWPLLPQPEQQPAQVERSQGWGCLERLRFWSRHHD